MDERVSLPVEHFPALGAIAGVRHAFVTRVCGIDARHDKQEALRRLDSVHRDVRADHGLCAIPFMTAEQVHGNEIAIVDGSTGIDACYRGCDGLITNRVDVCLGIYVADCCAVYLVDPAQRAIGLVHSGRKGTELDIVGRAIAGMAKHFETDPADLIVQLSPCIRPPHYEVDFAAEIVRSCKAHGARNVYDAGTCTACDLERYYSYRAEKGKTGRMLALLALASP
jgi:purine-nucleoside/S-methyl-5'-thioadenosine phosphorylase / adenosine deaminase